MCLKLEQAVFAEGLKATEWPQQNPALEPQTELSHEPGEVRGLQLPWVSHPTPTWPQDPHVTYRNSKDTCSLEGKLWQT